MNQWTAAVILVGLLLVDSWVHQLVQWGKELEKKAYAKFTAEISKNNAARAADAKAEAMLKKAAAEAELRAAEQRQETAEMVKGFSDEQLAAYRHLTSPDPVSSAQTDLRTRILHILQAQQASQYYSLQNSIQSGIFGFPRY